MVGVTITRRLNLAGTFTFTSLRPPARLTGLLWSEVRRHWLSVALSFEGLGLVGIGFLWRDRLFRVCGLGVFGALILKILFVDMAGAETIYRILSFIAAGCVLLAASYAYAKWEAKSQQHRSEDRADA